MRRCASFFIFITGEGRCPYPRFALRMRDGSGLLVASRPGIGMRTRGAFGQGMALLQPARDGPRPTIGSWPALARSMSETEGIARLGLQPRGLEEFHG
jgi:hypothetical protein